MKTTLKFFGAVLALSILTTSCKKDDEENNQNQQPTKTNATVEIGGETLVFTQGIIENYGTDTSYHEGTNFDITLMTEDLNYMSPSAGSGAIVYFEMFSTGESDIAPGVYTYDSVSLATNTFDQGLIASIDEGAFGDYAYDVKSGTVTVDKTGNLYSINAELDLFGFDFRNNETDTVSQSVNFTYVGELQMF